VIAGLHVLLYAEDAATARAFFRDVIGWDALDPGDGWLYLTLPPAELAVHPGPGRIDGRQEGRTEVFLMTTDVHATRAELEAKGVEFIGERDSGVCNMAFFTDPDGNSLILHRRYAP